MKALGKVIGELLSNDLKEDLEARAPTPQRGPRHGAGKSRPTEFDFLALIQAWPLIVGERLARHTRPKQNKARTLTVLTSHPAYSEQLSLLAPTIIAKIIKHFPSLQGQIQRINFHTNGPFFSKAALAQEEELIAAPTGPKARQALHPLSPEFQKLKQEAHRLMEEIPEAAGDPELRQSLITIYMHMHREN